MTSFQHLVKHVDFARYNGGPRVQPITLIVIHSTAGGTFSSSMGWMNRTQNGARLPSSQWASYHYGIDRERHGGAIWRMLPVDRVAYHAGDSWFPADPTKLRQGRTVNPFSIGLAFANLNDGEPLDPAQIAKARWLCRLFMARYKLPPTRVVSHREVSPRRKTDPLPSTLNMNAFRAMLA